MKNELINCAKQRSKFFLQNETMLKRNNFAEQCRVWHYTFPVKLLPIIYQICVYKNQGMIQRWIWKQCCMNMNILWTVSQISD
jgi:hypothetical protein